MCHNAVCGKSCVTWAARTCPGSCCAGGRFEDQVVVLGVARQAELKAMGVTEAEVIRIQAVARGYLVRWRMRRYHKHSSKMSDSKFKFFIGFFLMGKAWMLLSLLLALTDAFTDYDAPVPTTASANFTTPFQGHPHNWGGTFQAMVSMHAYTGFSLCVAMVVAAFSRKGSHLHMVAGRAFLVLWVIHMINGLLNSSTVLLNRGYNEELYPEEGFSMWLFLQFSFIADAVADFLIHGLADLQYKVKVPKLMRRVLIASAAVTMLHAAIFIILGFAILSGPNPSAGAQEYGIIFVLEVPPYLYLLYKNLQHWMDEDLDRRLNEWIVEHQRNMLFCANLTLITGLANVTFRIAPSATVTLWATQEIVVMYWVYRQNNEMTHRMWLAWQQARWAKRNRGSSKVAAAASALRGDGGGGSSGGGGAEDAGALALMGGETPTPVGVSNGGSGEVAGGAADGDDAEAKLESQESSTSARQVTIDPPQHAVEAEDGYAYTPGGTAYAGGYKYTPSGKVYDGVGNIYDAEGNVIAAGDGGGGGGGDASADPHVATSSFAVPGPGGMREGGYSTADSELIARELSSMQHTPPPPAPPGASGDGSADSAFIAGALAELHDVADEHRAGFGGHGDLGALVSPTSTAAAPDRRSSVL